MIFILLIIGISLITADQVIKYWAVNTLRPVNSMDFIKFGDFDFIGFRYAENDGAAFSSFSGARYFLLILNVILISGLIFYVVRFCKKDKLILISTTLIIAGGIGNIIDRARLGYVIDYIEVRFFDFAIFNFADMCVVIGACLFLLYAIISDFKEKKAIKSDE